jgi:AraC family transcriptional regulator
MDVEIADLPELTVATVHHSGPYNQINRAFEKLGAIAGPAGLFGQPGVQMIGLFYDDPESTAPEQLQSDAGLVVPSGTAVPQGLATTRVPAGRYAKTTHRGSYETLGDTWSRLMGEWLPASGHRLKDGPSIEIYRNTPGDVPKEQLVTELYLPLT